MLKFIHAMKSCFPVSTLAPHPPPCSLGSALIVHGHPLLRVIPNSHRQHVIAKCIDWTRGLGVYTPFTYLGMSSNCSLAQDRRHLRTCTWKEARDHSSTQATSRHDEGSTSDRAQTITCFTKSNALSAGACGRAAGVPSPQPLHFPQSLVPWSR